VSLTGISEALSTRFGQVQTLLSFVRRQENIPPTPDSIETRILRGLVYVHLYATFEYAVNRIVTGTIDAINIEQLPHRSVTHNLAALTLSSAFDACKNAASQKQWTRGVELINLRQSSSIALIQSDCLSLQNIWPETLAETFLVFGIDRPTMYDVSKEGYIRELVIARNKISHGETSPQVYGTLKRGSELQIVLNVIRDESFYLLDCFDEYLSSQNYRLA
jgi:hypothetical protein